jgi:hypothetical protein
LFSYSTSSIMNPLTMAWSKIRPNHVASMRQSGISCLCLVPMWIKKQKSILVQQIAQIETWYITNHEKPIGVIEVSYLETWYHAHCDLHWAAQPLDQTRCLFGQIPLVVKCAQWSSKQCWTKNVSCSLSFKM